MKKYHCPYCGDNSLNWFKKIPLFSNQSVIIGHRHYYCPSCSKRVALKSHPFVKTLSYGGSLCGILGILGCLAHSAIIVIVFIPLWVILYMSFYASQATMSKFIRSEETKEEFSHKMAVTFFDEIKNPKSYFHKTSVLIGRIEEENKRFPIRIELDECKGLDCKCSFYVIGEEKNKLLNKKIVLLDNGERIGIGVCYR